MSNLIDRQKAIDAVCLEGCGMCAEAIEEIPAEETEQKWIPCKDRLPEKDGKYLCCWQGRSIETGMFLNGHFRLYGEIKDNLVSAWMPLPDLYIEEE